MQKRAQNFFYKKCVSFSEITSTEDGKSTIQILRIGQWNHPIYGQFSISPADLEQFVFNFKANVRGVDLCVDENHEGEHKAIGWFRDVFRDWNALFATIEWNDRGLELINSKTYRYFSPELFFSYRDEETDVEMRNVLIWGGITNRPFFKGMKALSMSEPGTPSDDSREPIYFFNSEPMGKKFSEIVAELKPLEKVTTAQLDELKLAFNELPEEEQAAAQADVTDAESKLDDTPPADTPPEEKEKEGEQKPEDKPLEASEKQFSEEALKHIGMSLPEIREMQKKFSELASAAKFQEVEKKVVAHVYSEANKTGTILPKAKDKIAQFAAKLPDALASEFFEILNGKPFRTVEFKEIGGQEAKIGELSFNIPEAAPEGVTRGSFVLDFVAKKFQEADKSTYEAALYKASKYITDNAIV